MGAAVPVRVNIPYYRKGKMSMKILNRVNLIAAIVMWTLVFLTGLFNLVGLWSAWHLAGFACLACAVLSLAISVVTLISSFRVTDLKEKTAYIPRSIIILVISVMAVILYYHIFCEWGALNQWFHVW